MERAVVLVGVSKTGDLPELQAVSTGVQKMAAWARAQGINDDRLKIITDESSEVRVHQISDAIERIVALGTVEQLIIYFSGHGMNNRGEYWLLSRAPGSPNEAVNVSGSLMLAGYCGINHVVLISDACRTAADGIQAQHVTGSEIFPNEVGTGLVQSVDVFYACARGKPALEIKDKDQTAREYSAIYTEVLAECLRGDHAEVLDYEDEDENENESTVGLVRAWPLKDFLQDNVPKQLRRRIGRELTINQTPDAQINSRNAWLSRIPGLPRAAAPVTPVSRSTSINPFSISKALVSHAMANSFEQWRNVLSVPTDLPEAVALKDAAATYMKTFGPLHFKSHCGFKLRGARVARIYCKGATAKILDSDGSIVRVKALEQRKAIVLIELRNGTGVLVPALPDFIGELNFEGDELVNVSYEPSDNTGRWTEYAKRREELRTLRASIAASIGLGVFRLSGEDAPMLARRMQIAKGVDPSLALYAAYAYHDLQRRDLIKEMRTYFRDDLGFTFFDIALLSGEQLTELLNPDKVAPPFPMLSQGWSLLSAFRARLPGSLQSLQQHLLPSVWTMFDRIGVAKLAIAINAGEVRS